MKRDWDTPEQVEMFDEYLKDNPDGRPASLSRALGYSDAEWAAFQYGWNAAKKHFGVEE